MRHAVLHPPVTIETSDRFSMDEVEIQVRIVPIRKVNGVPMRGPQHLLASEWMTVLQARDMSALPYVIGKLTRVACAAWFGIEI